MPVSPRAQGYTAVQDKTEGDHLGGDKPGGDDRKEKKMETGSQSCCFSQRFPQRPCLVRRPASDHRASQ